MNCECGCACVCMSCVERGVLICECKCGCACVCMSCVVGVGLNQGWVIRTSETFNTVKYGKIRVTRIMRFRI
jgi:hypothetical protein